MWQSYGRAAAAGDMHCCRCSACTAIYQMNRYLHAVLIVFLVGTGSTALGLCLSPPAEVQVPNVTESGYLDIDDKGSRVFFIFYEAQSIAEAGQSRHHSSVPITLWLQVRL
jgi:hypothetical protein